MNGHTIVIPEQVYAELMPMAAQEDKDIGELVNEALRRYLWEARERQMDREMETYRALHAELKQRYLGQFVAIHHGAVVDSGADRVALSRQVRQKYGNAVVLITQVEQEPEREWMMRSPRFERGG
jgi:hypothetical protein